CRLGPVYPVLRAHARQTLRDARGMFLAAKSVDHHPDLHPARARLFQGFEHSKTSPIEIENIGFQVDQSLGLVDGLVQSREKLFAIAKQLDLIAFVPLQMQLFSGHARILLAESSSSQAHKVEYGPAQGRPGI